MRPPNPALHRTLLIVAPVSLIEHFVGHKGDRTP
ncbi:MAG: hypothetical protein USCGTAYLOR_01685 [Chromatiales bacterium USCg_Taylor]|nr:MAG: hypothetical protein USCGTAYLOR_01685 [Chromatiales bacterium USCg_Taylor]